MVVHLDKQPSFLSSFLLSFHICLLDRYGLDFSPMLAESAELFFPWETSAEKKSPNKPTPSTHDRAALELRRSKIWLQARRNIFNVIISRAEALFHMRLRRSLGRKTLPVNACTTHVDWILPETHDPIKHRQRQHPHYFKRWKGVMAWKARQILFEFPKQSSFPIFHFLCPPSLWRT